MPKPVARRPVLMPMQMPTTPMHDSQIMITYSFGMYQMSQKVRKIIKWNS